MRRLIIRPGGIGDTILAFPAMEHLRAEYTEVWVRSEIVPLVQFAERVRGIADTGLDLLGIPGVEPPARLIPELASFDEVWSWYGAARIEFRETVKRLGLPFRFLAALPDPTANVHAGEFFATQVGADRAAFPKIAVDPEQHGSIVIHPYAGSARKTWTFAHFVELGNNIPVEWATGPNGPRFENLHDLARWLAGARLFIGNDSGITHLAAAVGTPVVALFGPTDPAVWAPRGIDVRVVRGQTMEDIRVEDVLHTIRDLLASGGSRRLHT